MSASYVAQFHSHVLISFVHVNRVNVGKQATHLLSTFFVVGDRQRIQTDLCSENWRCLQKEQLGDMFKTVYLLKKGERYGERSKEDLMPRKTTKHSALGDVNMSVDSFHATSTYFLSLANNQKRVMQ